VVDTAMDTDHAQLQQGKQKGYNYTTDAAGIDRNGHGTHVGGIIFAPDFGIAYDLIKEVF
ncbi:S8 family serine peptidase, partial [Lacticaseibacillus paracasei]